MTLQLAIQAACAATEPFTTARNKALKSIRYRLRSGLLYAGLRGLECALVGPDEAQVFDGRDNQAYKARFYGAILHCKFEVELCES